MALSIYITYEESWRASSLAHRLHDTLLRELPEAKLILSAKDAYLDPDTRCQIAEADALLALLLPSWVDPARGNRPARVSDIALEEELQFAFACRIPVIPILAYGADIPPAPELPDRLTQLALCKPVRLRIDFTHGMAGGFAVHMRSTRDRFRTADVRLTDAELEHILKAASDNISAKVAEARHSIELDASLYAPSAAKPGTDFVIQCWLHSPEDRAITARFVAETASGPVPGPPVPLAYKPERGDRIDVVFDGDGLEVFEPRQTATVLSRPTPLYFRVHVPARRRRPFFPAVRFLQANTPIGRAVFEIKIATTTARTRAKPRPAFLKRYRRAFLSYATPDRPKVLEVAQLLTRLGTEVFQDVLSLEPGERWERRLFTEIDVSDLFLLFWTKAAAQSIWVEKETNYALKRQKRLRGLEPDVIPYVLEGPPPPMPPPSLRHLHFNDPIRAIIAGTLAHRTRRKPA